MKVFWLIPLLFSFAFGINSQIITGAYTLESTAIKEEKVLQNFLDKDKVFFKTNAIIANHKQNDKYYLVTVEPITDELILAAALKKIKIKYKHAYTFKLPENKINLASAEPVATKTLLVETASADVNSTMQEENSTTVQVPLLVEQNASDELQTQEISPIKQEPLVEKKVLVKENIPLKKELETPTKESSSTNYQTIGLLLLVIIIVGVLLFLLKKSSKKDTQKNKEFLEQQHVYKDIEVEDTDIIEINESDFDELNGLEEGDFGIEEPEEETENLVKSLKKRSLVIHGKIVKQDFKEFAGSRILIAEDNLINQKVITGLLGESGIEIVVANNGKETLHILENDSNFTMILMDAHMPIMDGFEATKAIRENARFNHIPIVALSGDIANADIKKMFNAGMDNHLEKPLRIDALYDVLYIYTNSKKEKEEPLHQVLSRNDLNIEKGLVTCSGDEDFYHEILNEFLEMYTDSDTQILQYLDAGDFISADKYLLDLIGVTSHIGADKLNAVAKELKEAIKDTQEKSYLTLAYQYGEYLHKLIQSIHEYK